jgi:hypothetical protein
VPAAITLVDALSGGGFTAPETNLAGYTSLAGTERFAATARVPLRKLHGEFQLGIHLSNLPVTFT